MTDQISENGLINVEVAFALPHKQVILPLSVPAGTTAVEAAKQSGLTELFEGVSLDDAKLGIFGKVIAASSVLKEGDRVEVYRPLIADPKEVRKARAARAKEQRAEKS